jgi:transcriptional regulator with GAF, ATPase, and Fis domain
VVPGLVGESATLREALEFLPQLAQGEMPILVLGESGTGKELIARQVHGLSLRAAATFVPFNCAAVAEHLLMSDLFGHVRGAFTGADRDRMGLFESARGGTVFLDEIGDLPLAAQGMFLRVLQEREIRRVGETLPRKVDVRVVAATHRGLEEMVEEGTFRRDLYFRLRVAEVRLPPLRRRGRDVLLLTRHFLQRIRHTGGIDAEAERDLLAHPWPGNVRELRNVLDVAVALSGGGLIQRRHLQIPESTAGQMSDEAKEEGGYHQCVLDYRRRLVVEALQDSDGNQAQAARRLGLTRQALSYLVKSLEITFP